MSQVTDLHPSLTTYLRQRLGAFQDGFRHNVAVVGPAGNGKSTLLQQALAGAPSGVTRISCVLQRDSVPGFVKRFATATVRAALDTPEELSWETLLQRAAPVAPNTVAAARALERYASGHLQAEAFVHALDLIPILHQELQRPCVLVLDEFLHLEELGLSHAFHELGKRVMTWPYVMFWVSSSSSCRAREILRERLQLLFGQFELVSLGPIETPAATTWMRQLCPGIGQAPDVVNFLLHWLGASPWYLNILLKRMSELARLRPAQGRSDGRHRRVRQITEAIMLDAAWDVLGSSDGVLHQWCAAQVDRIVHHPHGPLAREGLVAIARGARTSQHVAQQYGTRRHLSEALQLLVEQDLVQRKGACWVIPDQLFACWLSGVLGEQLQGERDPQHARATFHQAMLSTWTQWLAVVGEPLAARVEQLFAQFRNETVSLDHKTGRLPAFYQMNRQPTVRADETYLVAEGEQRRWCCLIHEGKLDEAEIAAFEQFCRSQLPRPSRKIVVARDGMELNAKLLAKEASMWVWEPEDVNLLFLLYGQPPLGRT